MSAGAIDVTHGGFLDPRVRVLDAAGRVLAVLTPEQFRRRPRPKWRVCPVHGRVPAPVARFGTTQGLGCVYCKAEKAERGRR
jgi:hypothetical protein